jgi:myo-inositol-1(or 4)-monophosphatase
VRDIRRHGSAALELCRIACGQADAYAEVGVNLWDYAAGVLVAEAAGARWEVLPGLRGRDLVVCAPAAGFDDVVQALLEAGFGGTPATPKIGE